MPQLDGNLVCSFSFFVYLTSERCFFHRKNFFILFIFIFPPYMFSMTQTTSEKLNLHIGFCNCTFKEIESSLHFHKKFSIPHRPYIISEVELHTGFLIFPPRHSQEQEALLCCSRLFSHLLYFCTSTTELSRQGSSSNFCCVWIVIELQTILLQKFYFIGLTFGIIVISCFKQNIVRKQRHRYWGPKTPSTVKVM